MSDSADLVELLQEINKIKCKNVYMHNVMYSWPSMRKKKWDFCHMWDRCDLCWDLHLQNLTEEETSHLLE